MQRVGAAQAPASGTCARHQIVSAAPVPCSRNAPAQVCSGGQLTILQRRCARRYTPHAAAQRRPVPAAAEEAQEAGPAQLEQESALQSFLRWLLVNGVEGVGTAGSKVALFEGEGGERGVVSLAPIAAGEVVMRIPLCLAITDALDEEEEEEGGAAGASWDSSGSAEAEQPWSVRLAGRLLAMLAEGQSAAQQAKHAQRDHSVALQCQLDKEEEGDWEGEGPGGAAAPAGLGGDGSGGASVAGLTLAQLKAGTSSPWQPYLQVLPDSVPSPLTNFTWDDVQAIEYPPMRKALDHASWLASSACQQPGGQQFNREQWEWALSVVHSRTFGAPGRQGGVGVRMLVPLIDMLNHAGDYQTSPPGASSAPAVQAFDSVRWELRAPAGPEGGWTMEVAAARDIAAGEELLLSYGERSNDDFFLHYGFLPPRNPHDDVALFTDIESCIDWWMDRFLPQGALSPQQLRAAINGAYSSAEDQDGASAAAAAVLHAVPEAEADAIRAELAKIKLSAGGMVDGRLLAAYRSLYEAAQQAQQGGQGGQLGGSWGEHLRLAVAARCRQILQGMPTPLLEDLMQLAEWEQQSGSTQYGWAAALAHYGAAVSGCEVKNGSLHSDAGSAADAAGEAAGPAQGASGGGEPADSPAPVLYDAGMDAALAQQLLQRAQGQAAQLAAEDGGIDQAAAAGSSILPLLFRAGKKMIAWDAVLLGEQ